MAVALVGLRPTDPVLAGQRFRLVWFVKFADLLPASWYDAPALDAKLRDALPGRGLVPVSAPGAVGGDEFLAYDVRLAQTFAGGKTVADVVQAATFGFSLLGSNLQLSLARVERIPLTTSSAQLAAGLDAARAWAREQLATGALDPLGKLWSLVRGAGLVVLVSALALGALYVYRKTR